MKRSCRWCWRWWCWSTWRSRRGWPRPRFQSGETRFPVVVSWLSCLEIILVVISSKMPNISIFFYKTTTLTTCHPSRLLTLGIWNSEGQSHWSSPTETMRRNTNTNIKTGITKHKHASPQSYRSSLQRQEVQEGESQAGTCDDQLALVELRVVMMDHHWCCRGSLWKKGTMRVMLVVERAPWERVGLLLKYGEGAIQGEQSYVVPPFHLEDMEERDCCT